MTAYFFGTLVALFEVKKKTLLLVREQKRSVHKQLETFLEVTRPLRHRFGLKRRVKEKVTMSMVGKIIGQHSRNNEAFFVIQIGSNDGRTGDPIYKYVVKNKWKGILIEPVPYIFKKLKRTYKGFKGLTFENVAIGERSGYKTFYRIERNNNPDNPAWYDQLGSFKKAVVEKHRNEIPDFYKNLISEKVRCISLNKLLSKHKVSKINLLHIDTEGYDYEIIKHIPFGTTKPEMIFYEHLHLTKSDENLCEKLLRDNGYKLMSTKEDTLAYLDKSSDPRDL
jgi:FkbM family methyltransferase